MASSKQTGVASSTNDNVEISAMMIAHNAEATIFWAIESCLVALPKNSELIVYLDGCTDKTSAIVRRFSDSRIILLEESQKRGISVARNAILRHTRGRWLAVQDADDISLPWRFKRQMKEMKRTGADFLFSNAILFRPGLLPMFAPQFPLGIEPRMASLWLSISNPFVHSSMMCRSTALRELDGYSRKPAEDYDLWLRAVLREYKLGRRAGFDVIYRRHSRQTTQRASWKIDTALQLAEDESLRNLRSKVIEDYSVPEFDLNVVRRILAKRSLSHHLYFSLGHFFKKILGQ
jgi:glycosyltransferase involved in cell wall biosynthesis